MSENCFVRETASPELIANVVSFCSECYDPIERTDTVFYDMKNYRYLCSRCKEELQERLNENCEIVEQDSSSLF